MTDSATDNRTAEMRKLLDESGVEHYDGTESTLWLKDEHGYRASADELSSGRLSVHIWCDTPEQAIAATLGEADEDCYFVYEGKKYPAELDFGFLGMMPITITVGGFRYLVEVPNGE